jgi:hypothetical protein
MLVGSVLIGSFAAFVTAHLVLVAGLFGLRPRWRGVVGLVPPLAPLAVYWAFRERLHVRASLWLACFALYVLALATAYHMPG